MDSQDTTKNVAPDQPQSTCRPEDVIPKKEKIIYGAADLFGGGQAAFISVILLAFFTDIIGIDAAVAGTVIMISKIWDAIIDPSMGIISDNTRWSKLGRRKPYMIIGGALIPFGLAFLFAPITSFGPTSKVVWMIFAYIIYTSISSLSQVPYMAMSSDISMDYKQRNSANTYKLLFDVVAAGIFYLAPSLLWTEVTSGNMPYLDFYFIIVFGFGLIFAVPLVVAGFLIKERAPFDLDKKEKLNIKDFFRCLTVKSYLWHLLMYVTAFLTLDMVSALAIYYTNYIGGAASGVVVDLGFMEIKMGSIMIIAPMMVSAAIGILIAYVIKAKFSKQAAFRAGLPLYIVGAILLACYQPDWNPILIPVFAMIMGFGFGGAQSMPWLVFADTVDVAELKFGYRPTANMSGVMTFMRTLATAFGTGLVGWVLGAANYIEPTSADAPLPDQPDSVLTAIRVLLAVAVTLLLTIGFISSLLYRVNDKRLSRIRYFNGKRAEVGEEGFTPEEKEEYDKLRKMLC